MAHLYRSLLCHASRSMTGAFPHESILRFSEGLERDPDVDVWLNSPPEELRSIARHWFALMRDCGDDVRELMHDGCPVACVYDAPFGYVNTFTSHVNVGF